LRMYYNDTLIKVRFFKDIRNHSHPTENLRKVLA
jgi:hypothetical protein